MAGSAEEVDHENAAFPHFVQETEELAAEDPLRAPEETADDISQKSPRLLPPPKTAGIFPPLRSPTRTAPSC